MDNNRSESQTTPPDMIEGYIDGYEDWRTELPASLANRSHCYRHGWLNGRDDRLKKPRASYPEIMKRYDKAIEMDANA